MTMLETIRLIIGIILTIVCVLGVVSNITIATIMFKSDKMRQLSVGILVAILSINDALFAMSYIGAAMVEIRVFSGSNNITQIDCTMQNVALYFTTPLSKLCLLILTLDRLYAILRPLAYRIRNHTRFAIITSISAYAVALLCIIYALLHANMSRTTYEHCVHTNVITPSAVLKIAGVILVFDMVTYITSIILVILVRYKIGEHTATVASNAAAKLDAIRQKKITRAVTGAVFVHFICASTPLVVLFATQFLTQAGMMTTEIAEPIVKFVTIMFIAETIINVKVYIDRLPGLKDVIWGTKVEMIGKAANNNDL